MSTTQEVVHTQLFGPDGVEASPAQAEAVAEAAAFFGLLGLADWDEPADGESHLLAADGTLLLTVYDDGHASTPLELPDEPEPEPAA